MTHPPPSPRRPAPSAPLRPFDARAARGRYEVQSAARRVELERTLSLCVPLRARGVDVSWCIN